jgi:hypothetical protein
MFARIPARLLLLSSIVLTSACTATVPQDEESNDPREFKRLVALQPSDVAVAPIRDRTSTQRVPLDLFRDAFVNTLIERRYSPLAPGYVDANWVEASFKGTPPPDALLVVSVTSWDASHLYSTGLVEVAADVALFQGGDTTGTVLWQSSERRDVDMGDGRGNPPPPSQDLIPLAVRTFAQQTLKGLPARDPVAAHAESN